MDLTLWPDCQLRKHGNEEPMAEKGENRKIRISRALMVSSASPALTECSPIPFFPSSLAVHPLPPLTASSQLQSSGKGALRRLKVILDSFLLPPSSTYRELLEENFVTLT